MENFTYAAETVCIHGLPTAPLEKYEKLLKILVTVLNRFEATTPDNIFLPYDTITSKTMGFALVKCSRKKMACKVVAALDEWPMDNNYTTKVLFCVASLI